METENYGSLSKSSSKMGLTQNQVADSLALLLIHISNVENNCTATSHYVY